MILNNLIYFLYNASEIHYIFTEIETKMLNQTYRVCLRCNPWLSDSHLLAAAWTNKSQTLLKQTMQQLYAALQPYLKSSCTHIKRNGGVKGTFRWLSRQISHFQFVARFDVASYYQPMQHKILLKQLDQLKVDKNIQSVINDYLSIPDINNVGVGMVAGGAAGRSLFIPPRLCHV